MTTTFVHCDQTTRLKPGDKFRVTISQGKIEHWLAGGTLASVYQSLTVSEWCVVVSEPPLDDSPVYVVDVRISYGTVGSSPPGSVAELLNRFESLSFYNAYEVTRLEQLPTHAPILEQRSQVIAQATEDQRQAGFDPLGALKASFGGLKGLVIAVTVAAVAIAVIVAVKATRTATA